MKFVRAPLRITLGGGGTDLPAWYEQHGGFLISAAIDKYIYFAGCERPFDKKFWLSYSKVEVCDTPSEIKHELLERCLSKYSLPNGLEIHSMSDLPGRSGMGSSGAFIVGTLKLLTTIKKLEIDRHTLAETACKIEMNELKRSSGKQDQYISAYGGLITMTMDRQGQVSVKPVELDSLTLKTLQSNLLIYYVGGTRESETILSEQSSSIKVAKSQAEKAMHRIQAIGHESLAALQGGQCDDLGKLMHEHWMVKRSVSEKMSNPKIDELYDVGLSTGALGGKLMGAGGGGYFMFYVPSTHHLPFRKKMNSMGLVELDWNFDQMGASVIYSA